MNRTTLGGLVLLNVALVAVLCLLSFAPEQAEAQFGGQRSGDYIMIAGQTPGTQANTIYITDLNNGLMLSVNYNQNNQQLDVNGFRNLSGDLRGGGGR